MKSVVVFLGIPYAMPPIDDLRFKPPRPHKGWQLWQATDFGPACPQPARHVGGAQNVWEMDEDCLYLNVYTPSVSGAVVNKYPVIVYIHGGQFEHGASNQFPPHALVAWHEVVVVTFNYRLGALGFLSTGDEHSPGNYGMLDQALAIRWVYENAHVFNGDPRRITLWGVGAGAAAAGLHVLTPRTKDKVFGVFAQSGSALADWAAIKHVLTPRTKDKVFGVFAQSGSALADWAAIKLPEQARNTSRVYAARIACPNDNAFKLVDCLKKGRSFNELANQEIEVGQQFMDEQIRKYVHKYNFTLNPGGVFDAIQSQYTFWPDPTNTTMIREEYINFLSDSLYKAPVDNMVKRMVLAGIPTYFYVMNTTVEAVRLPLWRQVPHGIDSLFLAGAPFMDKEFFPESMRVDKRAWTEGDRNMSEFFMKAVANFAHHGKPTPEV
ncbi:unnamed protein product [Notodromas monacha]|uniref:Carboxylesterase type B domain-containing protein n=1 Tax=Notodromas monacha TaxID=399045 RepID=A0A7R9C2Y1_9CRUS|nr:unnamed protein product [Notodromas monacha]CAG0925165.1 unnamed protein product [Notodromas monacha]